MARKPGRIWIGCSGWNYKAWRGLFYPKALAASGWLDYYAERFDTVEINNTFYRLPERRTFTAWAAQTPRSFLFAVKASRYLTHLKRLIEPAEPVTRLFARASGLGPQLGPVLYQLPASMRCDLTRLEDFLALLPRTPGRERHPVRHVMEFRHASWYRDDVFDALESRGVAVCLHDKTQGPYLDDPRGPFVYIRFHGTSGHYTGSYPVRRLASWADRIARWSTEGRDVYAYFNNDPGAAAPRNAATLRLLTGAAGAPRQPVCTSPSHTKIGRKIMPKFAIVVLTTCLAGASIAAQTTTPKQPPKQTPQTQQTKAQTPSMASTTFVKQAAEGSMAEVELATLAIGKATRDDVKQFAQKLKDDHTQAGDDLKSLAASKNVTLPSAVSAMHKATADRLGKLSGAAFDKAYIDEMVKDHVKDVADFKKHESDADADVKAFAAKTRPVLESHLSQAQSIQKSIGGGGK